MSISVKFQGKDALTEYGLILTSYTIGEPEPRYKYIDVPFRDGLLDITDYLAGGVTYGNRQVSITLYYPQVRGYWDAMLRKLVSDIHGKRVSINFSDMAGYLIGRCTVSSEADGSVLKVTVTASCEPAISGTT